jgi:hypothetical protein
MSQSLVRITVQAIRWLPFAFLALTIVEPGIWQPAWRLVESTSSAVGDHADQLAHELSWRLMTGPI